MFEVKITISAAELAQAINNLAAALAGVKPAQTSQQAPAPAPQPQVPASVQQPNQVPQQAQNYAPVNPTPAASVATVQTAAPVAPQVGPTSANPMQAPSAMTAPAGAPIAPPTAPVYPNNAPASTYPSNQPAAAMPPQAAQSTGVPVTTPPQYTIDQIMKGGATLMDAGRVDDLLNLLHSFGVVAVTDLKPEQLGAFATALRSLGAKI